MSTQDLYDIVIDVPFISLIISQSAFWSNYPLCNILSATLPSIFSSIIIDIFGMFLFFCIVRALTHTGVA